MLLNILKLTILLIVIDIPYLYLNIADFKSMINEIQGEKIKIRYYSALITYLIMAFGLYYFCLNNEQPFNNKLISSALLGFTVYGVFDFTSLTIIDKWKLKQSLIDTTWGTILFAITAIIFEKIIKTL